MRCFYRFTSSVSRQEVRHAVLDSHEETKTEHHPTEPFYHPESDLEGGGRQVGDGDVLQVVLQSVDERRDGEFQSVFVLKHDGVDQEEQRLLHITCSHRKRESQVILFTLMSFYHSGLKLQHLSAAALTGDKLQTSFRSYQHITAGVTGATLSLLSSAHCDDVTS